MTDYPPQNQGNPDPSGFGAVPPPPPAPEGYQRTAPIPQEQPTVAYPAPNDPQLGVDNTGVPTLSLNSTAHMSTTYAKALFDMSFRTFITRKLATVIYAIGLVVIGLGAVLMLLSGLAAGLSTMHYSSGFGILTIFGTLIGVPVGALIFVIVLRLSIEAGVALVAVAENTEQTAVNTAKEG